MAGLDSVGTVTIGIPEGRVQRFTVLNAPGALLWAAHVRRRGLPARQPPGAGSGEPAAIAKALLVGIVVLTVAWIVYHDLSDRRSRHAAGAKI
jgi:membrane protein DedA with SNARE-associated domain